MRIRFKIEKFGFHYIIREGVYYHINLETRRVDFAAMNYPVPKYDKDVRVGEDETKEDDWWVIRRIIYQEVEDEVPFDEKVIYEGLIETDSFAKTLFKNLGIETKHVELSTVQKERMKSLIESK